MAIFELVEPSDEVFLVGGVHVAKVIEREGVWTFSSMWAVLLECNVPIVDGDWLAREVSAWDEGVDEVGDALEFGLG